VSIGSYSGPLSFLRPPQHRPDALHIVGLPILVEVAGLKTPPAHETRH
jgi:hypothetical protein